MGVSIQVHVCSRYICSHVNIFVHASVYVVMYKFLSSLFSFISAAEASVPAALTVFASDLRRVRGSVEAKCW